MGRVLSFFRDGLANALTGVGTSRDARRSSTYVSRPLTRVEIGQAYSGSGLLRKIIRIPALDMVREWRDWTGLDANQAAKLYEHEKAHGLRQKIQQAEVLRGMGGGALILGLPGNPSEPAPANVGLNGLAFVNVVSRWHLSFTALQDDARLPGYGEPAMWRLNTQAGQQSIHPSRVIPFRADTNAALAMPTTWSAEDAFWGESTVQQVLEAVQDSDTARASFAALMHKARVLRFGIRGLYEMIAAGKEAQIQDRIALFVQTESLHNALVYDSGDEEGKGGEKIEDATYNFAGAKDLLNAYAEFVAAISDIPATRLLGRAPEGMNSSGDSQQADWCKKVRAMQTLDLGPCLDRLDRYLVPSAIGTTPPECAYDFAPLDTPDQAVVAQRFKTQMEAVTQLQATGAIPEREFNRGVQSLMIEEGYLPELEAALAEMPEDERYGLEQSEDDGSDEEGGDPDLDGGDGPIGSDPSRRAANDAAPRSLYVSRPVMNRAELQRWATEQGLGELQPDLHVTIAYSRTPIDWMKVEIEDWNQDKDGTIELAPGGVRIVEPLGDRTAVLLFTSSRLAWRHEQIGRAGASWDHADYQPHISLTGEPVDLGNVEPYRGRIVLGPERFEQIDGGSRTSGAPFEDYNPLQPRGANGRWIGLGIGARSRIDELMAGRGKQALLGQIAASAAQLLLGIGIQASGKAIVLDPSFSRHMMNRHGRGNEKNARQRALTRTDLLNAHNLINTSRTIRKGEASGRNGEPRFVASVRRGRSEFDIVGEVRKRNIVIVSMWKRKI